MQKDLLICFHYTSFEETDKIYHKVPQDKLEEFKQLYLKFFKEVVNEEPGYDLTSYYEKVHQKLEEAGFPIVKPDLVITIDLWGNFDPIYGVFTTSEGYLYDPLEFAPSVDELNKETLEDILQLLKILLEEPENLLKQSLESLPAYKRKYLFRIEPFAIGIVYEKEEDAISFQLLIESKRQKDFVMKNLQYRKHKDTYELDHSYAEGSEELLRKTIDRIGSLL